MPSEKFITFLNIDFLKNSNNSQKNEEVQKPNDSSNTPVSEENLEKPLS